MNKVFLNVFVKAFVSLILILVDVLILPITVVIGALAGITFLIKVTIESIKKIDI